MSDMKRRLIVVALLLFTGSVAVNGQCLLDQPTDCGSFCCPPLSNMNDNDGNLRDRCCLEQTDCCSLQENGLIDSSCGDRNCPDKDNPEELFDNDDNLRDQCCRYFRTGCCSQEENNTLNILFQVAIGASIGVAGLILIFIMLLVCCCCCGCCDGSC